MKKVVFFIMPLIVIAAPVWAKEYTVHAVSDTQAMIFKFDPASLTVQPGDTVKFVNAQDGMHSVVFGTVPAGVEPAESPMLEKKDQEWSYTFSAAGTYKFHCGLHDALGMRGEITASDAPVPEKVQ